MRQLVPILLVLAACDSVAPGNDMPPYGTIRGALTVPGPTTAPLRVALEWLAVQPGVGAIQIAQDTPVLAGSPASYEIQLTTLPPPEAVFGFVTEEDKQKAAAAGIDPDLRWAQAALLVYEDADNDGHLTVTHEDGQSPDHVIGKADAITVWFLMSETPAPVEAMGGLPVEPGLSVTRAPLRDPRPGECGYDTPDGYMRLPCAQAYDPAPTLLPIPATVDIAVTFDPHLDHYTCDRFWGSDEWPDWSSRWNQWSPHAPELCAPGVDCYCTGLGCPLDVPPAAAPVTCNATNTAYTYKTCVDDETVGSTRFCHYGHGELAAETPPPPGWPCP
jgi:hypothetical protein